MAPTVLPRTLIYGQKPPDLRFRMEHGEQVTFCRHNETLHLTDGTDLEEDGTYPIGSFLGELCRRFCAPSRGSGQPCPMFSSSGWQEDENGHLEAVELKSAYGCGGIKFLRETIIEREGSEEKSPEEWFFFWKYICAGWHHDYHWRWAIVKRWNANWEHLSTWSSTRRDTFDRIMWRTMRFPALIPQVWLNWLSATDEEVQKLLDENPSRVDFVAFADGQRHVIEIDGPSHYADYDPPTRSYRVDERAYAKNLKIERSLRAHGWPVTRIGRIEVRDLMESKDYQHQNQVVEDLVPFDLNVPAKTRLSYKALGVSQLAPDYDPNADDDDIPF